MMQNLTIVMYHYVRPIKESKFPGIKGLELVGFKRQLDFLQEEFSIVTVDQIKFAMKTTNQPQLPRDACWLTFDDGYRDHFDYVLPELRNRGLEGAFFPPAEAILHNKLLDVNAVHHVLASADSVSELRFAVDQLCMKEGVKEEHLVELWSKYGVPSRFDDAETIYVKRLLQHALPEDLRAALTDALFFKYVGLKPTEFCSQLYMSKEQVSDLVSKGMYVGSHGCRHYWLDKIDYSGQEKDIRDSLSFLEEIGSATSDWVMCYPYGAYNGDTLQILKTLGASLGVTTKVAKANLAHTAPPLSLAEGTPLGSR